MVKSPFATAFTKYGEVDMNNYRTPAGRIAAMRGTGYPAKLTDKHRAHFRNYQDMCERG